MDDLATEFFEDLLEGDEELSREMRLKHLGYEVSLTGDPLVDMWERQHAQGIVPDLDYQEPENAKERDSKIREAAREHYSMYGRGTLYKAPLPDMSLSIEDIENKRSRMAPDLSRFGVPGSEDLVFDEAGYPAGTSVMSPSDFDRYGNMPQSSSNQQRDDGFEKLDFETLSEFAKVGEKYSKK